MAYSESGKRATLKYAKAHLKRVPFDLPLERYDEVFAHTQSRGETMNGFIKRAIAETMERDKKAGE